MIFPIFLSQCILKLALGAGKETGCVLEETPGAEFKYCEVNGAVLAKEDVFWRTMEQFTQCYFDCSFERGRHVKKVCYNGEWQGGTCKRHAKKVKRLVFIRRIRISYPVDTTPPNINCPSSIYTTAPEHQTSAVVAWTKPTAYDSVDGARTPRQTSGLSSGSTFVEGHHTISYSASDSKGNSRSCSFDIHVSVIRCPPVSVASPVTKQCSNGGALVLGTECVFNCSHPGYRLEGKSHIECQYFGYWDFEYPKCVLIACGHPGSLSHGHVSFTGTQYGGTADYTCGPGYSLVGVSHRECQENETWSGYQPVCKEKSCSSSPCRNGGTCESLGKYFKCLCPSGKVGRLCEKDAEPPITKSCPSSQTLYTTTHAANVSWFKPTWEVLTETNITFSSNYVNTSVTSLPVGRHVVKYDAIKHNNGFLSSCNFSIDIRANPCPPLNTSSHSALVCNGWNEDYFSVCVQVCEEGYTLPRGYNEDTLYACAASGKWFPNNVLPLCVESPLDKSSGIPGYTDCMDQLTRQKLSETYILTLQNSQLSFLCDTDLCKANNVLVHCT